MKLRAWAKSKGLLDSLAQHRIFGFDLPAPAPGSPDHGYEFWIPVGPDVEAEGEITMKEFAGSLYAVTRCVVDRDPWRIIPHRPGSG